MRMMKKLSYSVVIFSLVIFILSFYKKDLFPDHPQSKSQDENILSIFPPGSYAIVKSLPNGKPQILKILSDNISYQDYPLKKNSEFWFWHSKKSKAGPRILTLGKEYVIHGLKFKTGTKLHFDQAKHQLQFAILESSHVFFNKGLLKGAKVSLAHAPEKIRLSNKLFIYEYKQGQLEVIHNQNEFYYQGRKVPAQSSLWLKPNGEILKIEKREKKKKAPNKKLGADKS